MAAWRSVRVRVLVLAAMVAVGLSTVPTPTRAETAPDSAIVVDAKTGKILYADAPDAKRYPASLTKMMTLYLLFEALDEGQTSMNTRMPVSMRAAAQQPSKLDVRAGSTISVRDAILALVTRSANDVAVVIGEYLGGSERTFAAQMTKKARELGMSATTFRNASGLPDPGQVTTARDMATLGRALREHYPQYYSFFSTSVFVYDGERIGNHNPLLGEVEGVDGIKTGYTIASGFNLVTSVKRDGREIVAVVLGGDTAGWRDAHMAELVADYLPRASNGARIAAAIPGGPKTAIAVAAASIITPLPRPRPLDEVSTVTVATAAPIAPAPAPAAITVAATAPVAPAPVATTATAMGTLPALGYAPETGQGDVSVKGEPAAPPPGNVAGWKIQIAAAPTRAGAEDMLDHALSTAQTVLASATPYTEPVTVRGATLYRARFSGFANQQAAKNACSYLVKRNFECLATSN